jgi:hypothetical protein
MIAPTPVVQINAKVEREVNRVAAKPEGWRGDDGLLGHGAPLEAVSQLQQPVHEAGVGIGRDAEGGIIRREGEGLGALPGEAGGKAIAAELCRYADVGEGQELIRRVANSRGRARLRQQNLRPSCRAGNHQRHGHTPA